MKLKSFIMIMLLMLMVTAFKNTAEAADRFHFVVENSDILSGDNHTNDITQLEDELSDFSFIYAEAIFSPKITLLSSHIDRKSFFDFTIWTPPKSNF